MRLVDGALRPQNNIPTFSRMLECYYIALSNLNNFSRGYMEFTPSCREAFALNPLFGERDLGFREKMMRYSKAQWSAPWNFLI
jgi:hypothetical protein